MNDTELLDEFVDRFRARRDSADAATAAKHGCMYEAVNALSKEERFRKLWRSTCRWSKVYNLLTYVLSDIFVGALMVLVGIITLLIIIFRTDDSSNNVLIFEVCVLLFWCLVVAGRSFAFYRARKLTDLQSHVVAGKCMQVMYEQAAAKKEQEDKAEA